MKISDVQDDDPIQIIRWCRPHAEFLQRTTNFRLRQIRGHCLLGTRRRGTYYPRPAMHVAGVTDCGSLVSSCSEHNRATDLSNRCGDRHLHVGQHAPHAPYVSTASRKKSSFSPIGRSDRGVLLTNLDRFSGQPLYQRVSSFFALLSSASRCNRSCLRKDVNAMSSANGSCNSSNRALN